MLAMAAVSMTLILSQFAAPEIDRLQTTQSLSQDLATRLTENHSSVAVLGYFRPTMVFYFGREVKFLDSQDEAVEQAHAMPDSILITTEKHYLDIKSRLPADKEAIERVALFPNRDELIVIGDRSLKR